MQLYDLLRLKMANAENRGQLIPLPVLEKLMEDQSASTHIADVNNARTGRENEILLNKEHQLDTCSSEKNSGASTNLNSMNTTNQIAVNNSSNLINKTTNFENDYTIQNKNIAIVYDRNLESSSTTSKMSVADTDSPFSTSESVSSKKTSTTIKNKEKKAIRNRSGKCTNNKKIKHNETDEYSSITRKQETDEAHVNNRIPEKDPFQQAVSEKRVTNDVAGNKNTNRKPYSTKPTDLQAKYNFKSKRDIDYVGDVAERSVTDRVDSESTKPTGESEKIINLPLNKTAVVEKTQDTLNSNSSILNVGCHLPEYYNNASEDKSVSFHFDSDIRMDSIPVIGKSQQVTNTTGRLEFCNNENLKDNCLSCNEEFGLPNSFSSNNNNTNRDNEIQYVKCEESNSTHPVLNAEFAIKDIDFSPTTYYSSKPDLSQTCPQLSVVESAPCITRTDEKELVNIKNSTTSSNQSHLDLNELSANKSVAKNPSSNNNAQNCAVDGSTRQEVFGDDSHQNVENTVVETDTFYKNNDRNKMMNQTTNILDVSETKGGFNNQDHEIGAEHTHSNPDVSNLNIRAQNTSTELLKPNTTNESLSEDSVEVMSDKVSFNPKRKTKYSYINGKRSRVKSNIASKETRDSFIKTHAKFKYGNDSTTSSFLSSVSVLGCEDAQCANSGVNSLNERYEELQKLVDGSFDYHKNELAKKYDNDSRSLLEQYNLISNKLKRQYSSSEHGDNDDERESASTIEGSLSARQSKTFLPRSNRPGSSIIARIPSAKLSSSFTAQAKSNDKETRIRAHSADWSMKEGCLPTEHQLKNTDNETILNWLKNKNTIERKKMKEERQRKRSEYQERIREANEKLERRLESQKVVKEWMKNKKQEKYKEQKEKSKFLNKTTSSLCYGQFYDIGRTHNMYALRSRPSSVSRGFKSTISLPAQINIDKSKKGNSSCNNSIETLPKRLHSRPKSSQFHKQSSEPINNPCADDKKAYDDWVIQNRYQLKQNQHISKQESICRMLQSENYQTVRPRSRLGIYEDLPWIEGKAFIDNMKTSDSTAKSGENKNIFKNGNLESNSGSQNVCFKNHRVKRKSPRTNIPELSQDKFIETDISNHQMHDNSFVTVPQEERVRRPEPQGCDHLTTTCSKTIPTQHLSNDNPSANNTNPLEKSDNHENKTLSSEGSQFQQNSETDLIVNNDSGNIPVEKNIGTFEQEQNLVHNLEPDDGSVLQSYDLVRQTQIANELESQIFVNGADDLSLNESAESSSISGRSAYKHVVFSEIEPEIKEYDPLYNENENQNIGKTDNVVSMVKSLPPADSQVPLETPVIPNHATQSVEQVPTGILRKQGGKCQEISTTNENHSEHSMAIANQTSFISKSKKEAQKKKHQPMTPK